MAEPLDLTCEPEKPAVVSVAGPVSSAGVWVAAHRSRLHEVIDVHGSVMVRGLGLTRPADAAAAAGEFATALVDEREGFARRRPRSGQILSSSEWPPDQPMCMHHEQSYVLEPPQLLLFACLRAPDRGGVTALADAHRVLSLLPDDLVERFEHTGWTLSRTYNAGFAGLPWTEVFGTHDPAAVERYCRHNGIHWKWGRNGQLRTRQRRPAVVRHPATGRRCWFNQIGFLSRWNLDPAVRDVLVAAYGEDGLPFDTAFGDDTPITEDIVRTIDEAYETCTVREKWQPGDLLFVDNIRMAHSREPYAGPRDVVVGLADPIALASISNLQQCGL